MNAPLVGVVLAGGLSSRLGHDKALVRLDGGTVDLLAQSVRLLAEVTPAVYVVGRVQEEYNCIADILPGHGPVGGIATVLSQHPGSACLVLSCDLPFMEKKVLDHLVEARAERPPNTWMTAYYQQETGHVEALVAIYEPGAYPYFAECLEQKLLKISRVVPKENQFLIPYLAADSLPFFNINYPADLEVARRMMFILGRA